jgi:hypothetical protein
MKIACSQDCLELRKKLGESVPLCDALAETVGGCHASGGIWRFFSEAYPEGGVWKWNCGSGWKSEWEIQQEDFYAFGEDIFGNQIVVQPKLEQGLLWNHESGEMVDLLLDPVTPIETVIESGLDWIDFYNNGSLRVAEKKIMDIPPECDLHWTTPLILGGQVDSANTSIVERTSHLIGHAKLWKQLKVCEPGAMIIPTRKPTGT